jgi:serine/threonine protein kinase
LADRFPRTLSHVAQTEGASSRFLLGSHKTAVTRKEVHPRSTTLAQWQVGQRIAYQGDSRQFQVEEVLIGGMGVVYVVTDTDSGDPFVAKTIQEQLSSHPTLQARFQREAEAWIKLEKHPNIVQALGFEYVHNKPLLYLEYVSGGSLRAALQGAELPVADILQMAVQICRGMRHASKMNITAHRDLKPDNILLTADKTAKVTDFGLVKMWDDPISDIDDSLLPENSPFTGESLTRMDAPGFGTKEYMPPEQWRTAVNADIRSDVYAFGVMLYEMLTGIRPFYGKTRSELRDRHFNYTPVPPSALRPDIPPSVDQVVDRCLQKRQEDRYPNFTPLHHELTRILQQEFRQVVQLLSREQISIAEHNERGAALFNLGKYQQALACFQDVLKNDPEHGIAWANYGVTLAELDKHLDALKSFDRALASDSRNAVVLTNKGLTLYELGRYEEAYTCYEQAVRIDQYLQETWRYRSEVLNKLGWYETAFYSAFRARQLDDQDQRAHYQEAIALLGMNRPADAIEAVIRYEQLVGTRNSSALLLRARVAYARQDLRDCLLICATVEQDAPEYRAALLLGMQCALGLGYMDEVEILLEDAPDVRFYTEVLELMLGTLEQYPAAISLRFASLAVETAVQSQDFVAARHLYELWSELRARSRVVLDDRMPRVDATRVRQAEPKEAVQCVAQGVLLLYLNEASSARSCLRRGVDLLPGHVIGWLNLGTACTRMEDVVGAVMAFDRASHIRPRDGNIWLTYAKSLVKADKYDAALRAVQKAQQFLGDTSEVLFVHGAALFGKGEYHPAIRRFDRALDVESSLAIALWNKSLCLRQIGRHLDANRTMNQARALDVRLWRLATHFRQPVILYPLRPEDAFPTD